jgi:hypothetical protein
VVANCDWGCARVYDCSENDNNAEASMMAILLTTPGNPVRFVGRILYVNVSWMTFQS